MEKNNSMAIAISPKNARELEAYADHIAQSGLFGQKNTSAVFTILATGIELGFSAVQSLRAIHIINGKPTLSAAAMMALVRRSPSCEYFEIDESNTKLCRVVTKKTSGRRKEVVFEFTIEDANIAKLSGANWTKYPAAMLRARAISGCARQEYPEALLGFYTPEEVSEFTAVENVDEFTKENVDEFTKNKDVSVDVCYEQTQKDAEFVESKTLELGNVRRALFATIKEGSDVYRAIKFKCGIDSLSDGTVFKDGDLEKVSKITKWLASDSSKFEARAKSLVERHALYESITKKAAALKDDVFVDFMDAISGIFGNVLETLKTEDYKIINSALDSSDPIAKLMMVNENDEA